MGQRVDDTKNGTNPKDGEESTAAKELQSRKSIVHELANAFAVIFRCCVNVIS